ncbi:unnamed protein product [Mesocestoides corti]|uniref:U1 small nuclear ribonucleoprotein 70 kDa n=1 Tax=Mesocestoides corti TaxID=53468 RepID=A0A158QU12_MESCO|nr:unnamed protein product [Mesocestoides corti]
MTQFLPPNLLALFAPRDPIPYLPPIEKHKNHRKLPYTGIAQFLGEFEASFVLIHPKHLHLLELKLEKREKHENEKKNRNKPITNSKETLPSVIFVCLRLILIGNPKKLASGTTNAYNTLFVARLNYDTSEHKLRREFDVYGPIKKICMVKDAATGKPRGYAFVEFEHERDMHAANKDANGRKIDGHRILTDIERGRTRPDWRPRRLGKGLGKSRSGPSDSRRDDKKRDEDRDRDRRKRSRSRDYRDRRRRSRKFNLCSLYCDGCKRSNFSEFIFNQGSRERRRSGDRSREHGRRDKYRRDDMLQYGEYGAEIKAEYNGDY